MSEPCSLRDKLASFGLATLTLTLLLPAALLAQSPTVSGLPEQVVGTQAPVPPTGPTGPTYSTLVVTSPATASGGPINATGNPYNVWCWNPFGFIESTPENYTAYSSYDPNFQSLPGAGTGTQAQVATEWNEVNWVLNHKDGETNEITPPPSVIDIQEVIWNLLIPGFASTYSSPLSPSAQALLNDALQYGPNFVPGPGQILGIALYNAGINTGDTAGSVQDLLIEYQLPTTPECPGLKITKSANVTTAKCTDQVTYSYTVTNTGNVPLSNVTVTDDNATPNYTGDDFTIVCAATLAPGKSATCSRTVYLPLVQYGVDAYNNPAQHQLITQVLPNGNIQVTLLEDLNIVDNTWGVASSPDWGSQGNNLLNHLGQDAAEFQFVDGNGNVVLDFAADYVSLVRNQPSGLGTAGVTGGAGHLYAGNSSNIVSIDTTITDDLNQNGNAGKWYLNSPPPNYPNWNYQCGYTVVIKGNCFGRYGYGGCNVKNVQHNKCKTGKQYQCNPTPTCQTVTNRATATASAIVNGQSETVTSNTAQASVQLTPGGQQSCQVPPTCHCTCWNCQHGDHQHCQNTQCHDQGCKQQQCQQQQRCAPAPCRPQTWWNQCNQNFQRCGRSW